MVKADLESLSESFRELLPQHLSGLGAEIVGKKNEEVSLFRYNPSYVVLANGDKSFYQVGQFFTVCDQGLANHILFLKSRVYEGSPGGRGISRALDVFSRYVRRRSDLYGDSRGPLPITLDVSKEVELD